MLIGQLAIILNIKNNIVFDAPQGSFLGPTPIHLLTFTLVSIALTSKLMKADFLFLNQQEIRFITVPSMIVMIFN